jgi:hypothetical protein
MNTNDSKLDAQILDGQLHKALPGSPYFRPIEPRMRKAVGDLRPERVEQVRNKPDNIPAIAFSFGEVVDADGNDLGKVAFPHDASHGANHIYREDGVTYIGRGRYWSDGTEEVDGVEYVKFIYGSNDLPCETFDWCTGHFAGDLDDDLDDEPDHFGRKETVWSFGRYEINVNKEYIFEDGVASEGYSVDLEMNDQEQYFTHDLHSMEFLAAQLEDAAVQLRSFASRESLNKAAK